MHRHASKIRAIVLGIAIPAAGYLAIYHAFLQQRPLTVFDELGIDPATLNVDTLSPNFAQQLGLRPPRKATELMAVLISADFCISNRTPGFSEAIGHLPSKIRNYASEQPEMVTRVIGIAVDYHARTGLDYLLRLADFDEIIAGGNWLNTATEKYLFGEYQLSASIPQLILLQRNLEWIDNRPILEHERLLDVVVGADEIIDWIQHGFVNTYPHVTD